MKSMNSIPSINYRGNYPGQFKKSLTRFDQEYDESSNTEITFSSPISTRSNNKPRPTTTSTKSKQRDKARRYYIQSTLEVNIDNQYPIENIEIYRQKIFPFVLTPNITLWSPEEKKTEKSRLASIWNRLSNSEPSIIGIVKGGGTVYTLPETIDLILFLLLCFGLLISSSVYDSSGNVRNTIYKTLSKQTFELQPNLNSECLGLPDENGVSSYTHLYTKRFVNYIITPNEEEFFNNIYGEMTFNCAKGTISDIKTLADYIRWVGLILLPSFINFRNNLNSPSTTPVIMKMKFLNDEIPTIELKNQKSLLEGDKLYLYPYDTESSFEIFDKIIESDYFNKSKITNVNTQVFLYSPFIGIKTLIDIELNGSLITGFYQPKINVNSKLIKTNSYSYIFLCLAFACGFISFFRLITHKDVIKSPVTTIKSSMNRVFAFLSSLLLLISVSSFIALFIPINWIWLNESSLEYSKYTYIHKSEELNDNFSEQLNHFNYIVTCDLLFKNTGTCSMVLGLWEFFWFLIVKISRKHATSVTVIVKKLTFPVLIGALIGIILFICYGLVGLILLGEFTSIFTTISSIALHILMFITGDCSYLWALVPKSPEYSGLFFIPMIILFGIIFPSYVYAFFCHIYNSTVDTVEWCWDNCSKNYEARISISPWYIEDGNFSDKETKNNNSENKEFDLNMETQDNSHLNDLIIIRNRYADFMSQSTTFERLYDFLFSRNTYFSKEQKREIELNKYDTFEQTRKMTNINYDKFSNSKTKELCSNSNISNTTLKSEILSDSYETLITKSIHEYYQSIFNSGKFIFSNPGLLTIERGDMISTSQQLMYRMVNTMESSIDFSQSIMFSKSNESNYSNSIGLNDQNGLPLLVSNVMASSPCPNMENLLTFTERVNQTGESVWFGIIILSILCLLIASNIIEYRKNLVEGDINSIFLSEFYSEVNINMLKPIISKDEQNNFDLNSFKSFISNPVSLNVLNSITPNEISYWISISISNLIFNTSSEFQEELIFPEKTGNEEINIIFNRNLLYKIYNESGIIIRTVFSSKNFSTSQFVNASVDADNLYEISPLNKFISGPYNEKNESLIEKLELKFTADEMENFPNYYYKVINADNFKALFKKLYENLSELLNYSQLAFLEITLPVLMFKNQILNFLKIEFDRQLTGKLSKQPSNIILSLDENNANSYISFGLEALIFVLIIGYLTVFSLECKKFILIYKNSPASTRRSQRSAIFCFFNYIFSDFRRMHDIVIILMVLIRSFFYCVIIYYKIIYFQQNITMDHFYYVYNLTSDFTYINTSIIWIFIIRLMGPFISASSNHRFLIYSYYRTIVPLLLTFIFLFLLVIGLILVIFINFSNCNDKYSSFFGSLSATIDLFTGNFDYLEAYSCSSSMTVAVLLPLMIAIFYLIIPVYAIIILRGLWLSKKESIEINKILKIVMDSHNKRVSDEYEKYIKNVTGANKISEREIWENVGIDYDEDDPIDRKKYEEKKDRVVHKTEIPPPKVAELSDEQWDASPDFIKEWAEYEAESFIDRFRNLEREFKMTTSSTGYYSKFVSKWESSVYKELQLLEVTTNEAEQLLRRLQRAIKGTANRVRISQALQTSNLESAIREKEEERDAKRALLKTRKNKNQSDVN